MGIFSAWLVQTVGGACAATAAYLYGKADQMGQTAFRVVAFVCGGFSLFFAAKPPQINPKPAPPRLPDPPAQHAPAPAPKQTPKKGKGGIKQPPKTSAKPARIGEEGWIVLGPETVIYFEKQRKKWKTKKMIEAEIRQAQNEEFINAEYEDYQQL